MMEKCWEKPCICYFNRRSVKNGRRFLYKITASIFMRGLQEKGRILKKIFCFSNFAGQEEEGISSFFKISASLNQFLLSRIWELRRAYSTRCGSPPRMRGQAQQERCSPCENRITPADAGTRQNLLCLVHLFKDHPRGCGDKITERSSTK